MFGNIKKDKQLVDIITTTNGAYLTLDFKNEYYKTYYYNEPFRIKGKESLVDTVNYAAQKNPKYKLNCKFKSPFGYNIITKSTFKEYIPKLRELIKNEFKNYMKNTPKEKRDNNKIIYQEITDWYYEKTFQTILKRSTKNNLESEIFPSKILIDEENKRLNVISYGLDEFGVHGNARIEIYELLLRIPRKRIFKTSTHIIKKINTGFVNHVQSNFGLYKKKRIKDMIKDGRCIIVDGFPSYITFDSEINLVDPQILEMRKI